MENKYLEEARRLNRQFNKEAAEARLRDKERVQYSMLTELSGDDGPEQETHQSLGELAIESDEVMTD